MLLCVWLGLTAMLLAQQPDVHYWHQGVLPPGAIGSRQLQRGGPLPGFYQPVEIKAPAGALVSLAVADQFDEPRADARKAGMLIGSVYRLRVTNIRMAESAEVFPTVEVIDRIYAPQGQECRFAIPVEIAEDDLKLALAGKFVTRVIYLENPQRALPVRSGGQPQRWFEAAPGQDPLAVADSLGRPVAILRIGGRLPDPNPTPEFFFGSPTFVDYPQDPNEPAVPAVVKAKTPSVTKTSAIVEKLKQAAAEKPAVPKVQILPPPPTAASLTQNQATQDRPTNNTIYASGGLLQP